ncbi:MAG: c-type cytochrome [Synechococcus sp.]
MVLATMMTILWTPPTWASSGQELFNNHCAGCHHNGGNIIRRGRTLKLAALKRNGLDDPEAIARIAREGIGQMSGYSDVLGQDGDQLVAAWIWEQAQNAWIQG